MKLVTYNLHKGKDRKARPMMDQALEALAHLNADILLCQEVFRAAELEPEHDQCLRISQELGLAHYAFGPNKFYRRGSHGNATFSRHPIQQHRNVDVSLSPLEKRGILHSRLATHWGQVDTWNVHFSLTARQRKQQFARLRELLEDSAAGIVCGDFNDWSGQLDKQAGPDLDNALTELERAERRTFPSQRPLFALDRFYLRGFEVENVRVLREGPWANLSDHLPVEVVLQPTRRA